MRLIIKLLFLLTIAVTAYYLLFHYQLNQESSYITSEKCQNCHQENYQSWKENTLHPYMFRPLKSEDEILGDFESGDPAVTFSKSDVQYILGNKWEQMYIKVIDGEYYPLPAKWHIMLKKWEPYKVDSWHKTKMSYKCNGCHTTGFDPNTLKFSEFGIGCEACHGPGSLHQQNEMKRHDIGCSICHMDDQPTAKHEATDIIRSVSPSVCGQCHNRGTNTDKEAVREGKFNFPLNFRPDGDVTPLINPSTPKNDKKGKYWWGNGISKNRHQEFSDWGKSKHAKAHTLLVENYKKDGDRGELKDECLQCHSTEYRNASADARPDLDHVRFGITCITCHEPHGHDKKSPTFGDGSTVCAQCHIASMGKISGEKGRPHIPCPATAVSCADCHMPKVVKTGGFFSLRSHAFKVIPPAETLKTGTPNSCQNGGCHDNKSIEWALDAFKTHYPDFKDELITRQMP